MAKKILLADDTTGRRYLGPAVRADSVSISSGQATLTVTFSTAMANTTYTVVATMFNSTDTNPQFQPITITSLTTSGFVAKWNANTDSANYKLNYVAIGIV